MRPKDNATKRQRDQKETKETKRQRYQQTTRSNDKETKRQTNRPKDKKREGLERGWRGVSSDKRSEEEK
jgi:hypothetical protein